MSTMQVSPCKESIKKMQAHDTSHSRSYIYVYISSPRVFSTLRVEANLSASGQSCPLCSVETRGCSPTAARFLHCTASNSYGRYIAYLLAAAGLPVVTRRCVRCGEEGSGVCVCWFYGVGRSVLSLMYIYIYTCPVRDDVASTPTRFSCQSTN